MFYLVYKIILVSQSLDHLSTVSGVGSSPAPANCESSQALELYRFRPSTDWPVSYELK